MKQTNLVKPTNPESTSDNTFDLKKFLELKKRVRDQKLGYHSPGNPPLCNTTPDVALMVPSPIVSGEDDSERQKCKVMRYTQLLKPVLDKGMGNYIVTQDVIRQNSKDK